MMYIIVQILHIFFAHVIKLKVFTLKRIESRQGNNSTSLVKIK